MSYLAITGTLDGKRVELRLQGEDDGWIMLDGSRFRRATQEEIDSAKRMMWGLNAEGAAPSAQSSG